MPIVVLMRPKLTVEGYRALAAMVSSKEFTVDSIREEAEVDESLVRLLLDRYQSQLDSEPIATGRPGAPPKRYRFKEKERKAMAAELNKLFDALSSGSFKRHDQGVPERSVRSVALSAAETLLSQYESATGAKRVQLLAQAKENLETARLRNDSTEPGIMDRLVALKLRIEKIEGPEKSGGPQLSVRRRVSGATETLHIILGVLTEEASDMPSFFEGVLLGTFAHLDFPVKIATKRFKDLAEAHFSASDCVYLVLDTLDKSNEKKVVERIEQILTHAGREAHLCVIDGGHNLTVEKRAKALHIDYHAKARNHAAIAAFLKNSGAMPVKKDALHLGAMLAAKAKQAGI